MHIETMCQVLNIFMKFNPTCLPIFLGNPQLPKNIFIKFQGCSKTTILHHTADFGIKLLIDTLSSKSALLLFESPETKSSIETSLHFNSLLVTGHIDVQH